MFRMLAAAGFIAGSIALPVEAEQLDKIKVGLTISLAQAPFYIALEKGYLAAERIEVEAMNFRGAQDAVSAMATGDLDVNLGAINAGFFNAANQGLDLRAVASLGIQPLPVTATPLLARKDLWESGAIHTGASLKGRTVAVNTPGASPEYFLSLILDRHGMTLADVNETMISFGDMVIALQNKSVEAAVPAEPFATLAISQGVGALVAEEAGTGGGEMTTVFFFSGHLLRDRSEVGLRFLRAVIRGAREAQGFYNKDPDMVALLAKSTGIKAETIAASVPYAFDPDLDIARYADSLRRQESQHMKDGRLVYKAPLPMDKVMDAALVHQAAASLR